MQNRKGPSSWRPPVPSMQLFAIPSSSGSQRRTEVSHRVGDSLFALRQNISQQISRHQRPPLDNSFETQALPQPKNTYVAAHDLEDFSNHVDDGDVFLPTSEDYGHSGPITAQMHTPYERSFGDKIQQWHDNSTKNVSSNWDAFLEGEPGWDDSAFYQPSDRPLQRRDLSYSVQAASMPFQARQSMNTPADTQQPLPLREIVGNQSIPRPRPVIFEGTATYQSSKPPVQLPVGLRTTPSSSLAPPLPSTFAIKKAKANDPVAPRNEFGPRTDQISSASYTLSSKIGVAARNPPWQTRLRVSAGREMESASTTNRANEDTPNTAKSLNLVSVSSLPDKVRSIFSYKYFNAMQSQCFDTAFGSDKNLVVSAPTGCGKTCVMELAIVRMLMEEGGDQLKVIYMCPTKALCGERCQDWQKKFRVLGVTCNELTGDSDSASIITTPEKWDSTTRKWRDHRQLMSLVRLMLLDEVHMLNEGKRGSTLEVVVSRMRTVHAEIRQSKTKNVKPLRMLAISATIPNIEDIAEWLREEHGTVAEMRLTPGPNLLMPTFFSGCSEKNTDPLMEVIKTYSSGKSVLIFCPTRKSVYTAASQLAQECRDHDNISTHPLLRDFRQKNELSNLSKKVADKGMKGLDRPDRALIETAFMNGTISVICTQDSLINILTPHSGATSTLSVGVNFPAHLVIIKGVHQLGVGNFEYSELDITQMIGRAGRPQFDDSGTAVLMVPISLQKKYEGVVYGKEIVESRLKSSFLYIRIRKNPTRYGIEAKDKTSVERHLESICVKDLKLLHDAKIIDRNFGQAMAKYYLRFETAKTFVEAKPRLLVRDALECLSKGKEFEGLVKFRSGDKGALNGVNKSLLYPLKGKVKDCADKYSEYSKTEVEYFVNVGLKNAKELKLSQKKVYSSATFVVGTSENDIVDYRRFSVLKLKNSQSFRFRVKPRSTLLTLTCILALEDFVGLDIVNYLDLKPAKKHLSIGAPSRPLARSSFTDCRLESTESVDLGVYCKDLKTRKSNSNAKAERPSPAESFDFDALYPDLPDVDLTQIEKAKNATKRKNKKKEEEHHFSTAASKDSNIELEASKSKRAKLTHGTESAILADLRDAYSYKSGALTGIRPRPYHGTMVLK
ncbi:Sec63 [Phlyctochytrium planicorne]|nr:Sec63 [Phlyctochytrium planicorne]